MDENKQNEWFERIETIVAEPLKFKAKLAIGEDAYTSLRLKNATFKLWDAAGAAGSAAAIAKSSAVASTFFAPKGILALGGLFGTATTPIGWVVAAGVIAGGGWIGITSYLKHSTSSRVTVVPNFINTPMDVLALGLFDLMAPLALKVALIDGEIDTDERDTINSYFVEKWGYSDNFVCEGIAYIESKLSDFSIKKVAQALGEFKKQNKDCNSKEMSREIVCFLTEVIEADGRIDEREEMALENVKKIFDEADRLSLKQFTKDGISSICDVAKKIPLPKVLNKKTND
jgi:tellurite resistance protein